MSEATVIKGDCLEAISQMDEGIFDLVLSDPPYFEYKTGHRKDKESKLSQALVSSLIATELEKHLKLYSDSRLWITELSQEIVSRIRR